MQIHTFENIIRQREPCMLYNILCNFESSNFLQMSKYPQHSIYIVSKIVKNYERKKLK